MARSAALLISLALSVGCTTPLARPVRPLPKGGNEVGAAVDATLGYGAFYRRGITDRVMVGAGGGSGWPDPRVGRGAALAEVHYALITPSERRAAAEFLTVSFDTAWQGFEENSYRPGQLQIKGEIEGVRGSRLLFQPGVHWGVGNSIGVLRVGVRAQVVRLLECETLRGSEDLCRSHRPTHAKSFVNGIGEIGVELKLGPVVPFLLGALATDKSIALAGGLGFRFGGR